jgi:hypothetical protein
MFQHAAKLNFEGIISKRADAPYRSERTEAWLKGKTIQTGKFAVIGFDKDPTGVAALHLGKARRQRPSLHRQGRHRLVPHRLEPDPKAAQYGGEPEIQADQTDQNAPGSVG